MATTPDPRAPGPDEGPPRMNSALPARKVVGSSLAVAIVQIVVWLNATLGGPPIPPEISGALTVLVSFAVGYWVRPGEHERILGAGQA